MALGSRLKIESKDFNGDTWKIQIMEEGYGGTEYTAIAGAPPFTLEYGSNGDGLFDCIKASTLKLNVNRTNADGSENTYVTALLSDIIDAEEQIYYIKLSKNSNFYWCGLLLQDLGELPDLHHATITLCATDGLGRLKDIPFPVDDYSASREVKYDLIVDVLNVNNLNQFWGSTDNFIASNINWYDTQMYSTTPGSTLEPMLKLKVHPNVFYKDATNAILKQKPTDLEPVSCKDALESMLTPLGARIHQENGLWHILQPSEYTSDNFVLRKMRKDGTNITAAVFYHEKTVDQVGIVRNGCTFDYLPAYKQVRINHNVGSNKLLPQGVGRRFLYYADDDATWTLPPLQGNNGSTYKVNVEFGFQTTVANLQKFKFDVRVYVEFSVGTGGSEYRLKINPINNDFEWVNTSSGGFYFYCMDQTGDDIGNFEAILPEPPWDYEETASIYLKFEPGYRRNGTFTPNTNVHLNIGILVNLAVLPDGEDTSDVLYKADNGSFPNNSVVMELPSVLLADCTTRSQLNGLNVIKHDSTIHPSNLWKKGGSGTGVKLLKLLCTEVLAMQYVPVEQITGTIHLRKVSGTPSELMFINTIVINGFVYLPISVTLSPSHEATVLNGTWALVNYDTGGITTGTDGGGLYGFGPETARAFGTLDRRVSELKEFAVTLGYLLGMAGFTNQELDTVTSYTSISTLALDNPTFVAGDKLVIVDINNPTHRDEITLSAAPTNGDVSISIDAVTLNYEYPKGAMIQSARGNLQTGNATFTGVVTASGLPTSDPGVSGQLWNDSDTVKVSP